MGNLDLDIYILHESQSSSFVTFGPKDSYSEKDPDFYSK